MTADANRKAGHAQPRPGATMYISTARGIKNRRRAGLLFSETPAEVSVIDASDADVAEKQLAGAYVVNPWGAERILEDINGKATGLLMFSSKPGEAPVVSLEATSTDDLEAELERRRATPKGTKPDERLGAHKVDKSK
jgi:hypothetical protein